MSKNLSPEKALIFRCVHRENVSALMRTGLWCGNAAQAQGRYLELGSPELIEKRRSRLVECSPGGTLGDYVPFYFTPFSPMMYNIKTGHNGIKRRPSQDIVIFLSSLHHLRARNVRFVFTDRHAYIKYARFSSDIADLTWIDWPSLQARNFRKHDVDRFERYQAEALVYKHMPTDALLGIACYNDAVRAEIEALVPSDKSIKVVTYPAWYL